MGKKGEEAERLLQGYMGGELTPDNYPFDLIIERNKDCVQLIECKDRRVSQQNFVKLNPKQKKRQEEIVTEFKKKYKYVDTTLFVLTKKGWLWRGGLSSTRYYRQMFRAKF